MCSLSGGIAYFLWIRRSTLCAAASLVAQTVKRLSTVRETQVRALGWEDPLEKQIVINNAAMNTEVHMLFPIRVFFFFL